MRKSHARVIIGLVFVIIVITTFALAVIKVSPAKIQHGPPHTPTYWTCDTCSSNGACTCKTTTNPNGSTNEAACIKQCSLEIMGACEWSSQNGYTGKCTTDLSKSDNMPINGACAPNGVNVVCNARKNKQMRNCDGTYCPANNDACCVANLNQCVEVNCCIQGKSQKVKRPPFESCQSGCSSSGQPKCNIPEPKTIPYYFCKNSTCQFVNSSTFPTIEGVKPENISTSIKKSCVAQGCEGDVFFKVEKIPDCSGSQCNWCNYAVTTTKPSGDGWLPGTQECKIRDAPLPPSGWCFQPPTEPDDKSCSTYTPDIEKCLGTVLPHERLYTGTCPNPSSAPDDSPWVPAKKCGFGALSFTGKRKGLQDESQPFSRCSSVYPNCMCVNQDQPLAWDGHTYQPCQFGDPKQSLSGLFVAQCVSEIDSQVDGKYPASQCRNQVCECSFPNGNTDTCQSNWWDTKFGTKPCDKKGCAGCTAEFTSGSSAQSNCVPSSSYPDIYANINCARLQNSLNDTNTYICPDGTPCTMGDADSPEIDQFFDDLADVKCAKKILRTCANDLNTPCIQLNKWLKSSAPISDRCILYNSLAGTIASKDSYERKELVEYINNQCGN